MGRLKKPLHSFLASKPLYYEDIDYEYFPDLWGRIKNNFDVTAKIIHIIGTNGKGSTSATLHNCLLNNNISVGSYNSPELLSFIDMYTLNGKTIVKSTLEVAHNFLQKIIPHKDIKKISRFEYTTLLAFKIFQHCEFIILEAGLGGEYDATNVLEKKLSVVTPIGIDHTKFLGNSIEEITNTKLRSVRNKVVSGKQEYLVAEEIINKYKKIYNSTESFLTDADISCIQRFGLKNKMPDFMIDNIMLGVLAYKNLGFKFKDNNLKNLSFKGRFQKVKNNVILDVGHNPLSAKKIFDNIPNNTILIYNSYIDKNYSEIIQILCPKLKEIILMEVSDKRACETKYLLKELEGHPVNISIMRSDFSLINNENYLIFGSFSVVKEFIIRFL